MDRSFLDYGLPKAFISLLLYIFDQQSYFCLTFHVPTLSFLKTSKMLLENNDNVNLVSWLFG